MRTAMLVLGLVAVLLAGSVPAGEKKTIGVTLLSREHVFFNIIEEAMVEKARELGYDTVVVDSNMDINRQMNQLEDFIVQGVDAVIIAPAAVAGLEPAIKRLAVAKIPVVTIDNKVNSDDPIIISSIVGDNYSGGHMAGEWTVKHLNGKGKVAIITYSEVVSCIDRENGYLDAVKGSQIEVLDTQSYSGSSEKAQRLVQDMLLKYPDLQLIFTVGDPAVIGGVAAAKAAGKRVEFIGFGGDPAAVDIMMNDGMMVADIDMDPAGIGRKSVETLDNYWNGRPVEKDVKSPCSVMTKQTVLDSRK